MSLQPPSLREAIAVILDEDGKPKNIPVTTRWWGWFNDLWKAVQTLLLPTTRFSGTVTTAKITPGGTNGTMTFVNGVLSSQVQST